jgi:DNA-binding XRE family transcriptional regulator
MMTNKNKGYVSLSEIEQDLRELPGFTELLEDERAALRAAEFIENSRKKAHLTQKNLAEKIGVSQARISQMEQGQGRYGPSLGLLERIATACGGYLLITLVKD